VHVKLTKEVHTSLREKLFRHGITMQDLFQEAAEMVLLEGSKSDKFLEKISKKKLMVSIEKINRRQNDQLGELDSDTLYNLLEDSNDDEANTEG
jgi:heterodisulfide reductase subunit C